MKKIINSKAADKFIGLVTPIVMIYTSGICMYSYFGLENRESKELDVLVIFLCSFLLVYGLKSLLTDLKIFGIKWTLRNFFKNELRKHK